MGAFTARAAVAANELEMKGGGFSAAAFLNQSAVPEVLFATESSKGDQLCCALTHVLC